MGDFAVQKRGGRRPQHFEELAALLEQRFGSTNRVIRARAGLRNIQQDHSEDVRSYSIRFAESFGETPPLMMKNGLRSQFIVGPTWRDCIHGGTSTGPTTLTSAIEVAEQVEITRKAATSRDTQATIKRCEEKTGIRSRELQG